MIFWPFRFIKWLISVVVTLVLAAAIIYFLRNPILAWLLPGVVERAAGVRAFVGSVSASPLDGKIEIKDVILPPPMGFDQEMMLDARRIYLDLHGRVLGASEWIFSDAQLDIRKLVVERDSKGRINWKSLGEPEGASQQDAGATGGDDSNRFRFDRLTLAVDELVWVDAGNGKPYRVDIPLNLRMELEHVTEKDMARELVRAAARHAKGKILLKTLLNNLERPLPEIKDKAEDLLDKIKEAGKDIKSRIFSP